MQPQELSDRISNLIDRYTETFQDEVLRSQTNVYNELAAFLNQLELSQGRIKTTTKNLRLITQVDKVLLNSVFTKAYKNRVDKYLNGFSETQELLNSYFTNLVGEAFTVKGSYEFLVKESIKSATAALGRTGLQTAIVQSAKKIIEQNITVGARFSDMMEALRQDILGGEVSGSMERYVRQITNDSLSVFNRTYMQAVTNDLGLNKFKYSGSSVRDTREFCQQRANRVYTEEEVRSWANLSWQGKIRGTNETTIFQYAGGYNCRHILIPTL